MAGLNSSNNKYCSICAVRKVQVLENFENISYKRKIYTKFCTFLSRYLNIGASSSSSSNFASTFSGDKIKTASGLGSDTNGNDFFQEIYCDSCFTMIASICDIYESLELSHLQLLLVLDNFSNLLVKATDENQSNHKILPTISELPNFLTLDFKNEFISKVTEAGKRRMPTVNLVKLDMRYILKNQAATSPDSIDNSIYYTDNVSDFSNNSNYWESQYGDREMKQESDTTNDGNDLNVFVRDETNIDRLEEGPSGIDDNIEGSAEFKIKNEQDLHNDKESDNSGSIFSNPRVKIKIVTPSKSKAKSAQLRYQCPICQQPKRDKDRLFRHLKSHTDEKPFICPKCLREFQQKERLIKHKRSFHQGIINPNGNTKRSKRSPKRKLTQKCTRLKCDECGKGFSRGDNLCIHKSVIHAAPGAENSSVIKCDICLMVFKHLSYLRKHKRLRHSEHGAEKLKRFKCSHPSCDSSFYSNHDLIRHIRSHTGEKPFKCDQCPKWFSERGTLKRHQESHAGVRSHLCETCGQGFTQLNRLRRHKQKHIKLERS